MAISVDESDPSHPTLEDLSFHLKDACSWAEGVAQTEVDSLGEITSYDEPTPMETNEDTLAQ